MLDSTIDKSKEITRSLTNNSNVNDKKIGAAVKTTLKASRNRIIVHIYISLLTVPNALTTLIGKLADADVTTILFTNTAPSTKEYKNDSFNLSCNNIVADCSTQSICNCYFLITLL